ncbi:Na+/H+ antiporter subunit B [Jannaschia donghaensis]|uniref:Multiple resistance and pH homeostasis protein B n=1 Tax=Jannaschia donghaensis TaxID=420998 RepID=A0A0M6YIF0_9RHOB|nr:Na+/H+ antiporter subunit B [Jannaschia donghaensis]CTQ49730.1 Multiple resistance and pH homeostasis protein B [Jannaschia donghaensis]
MTSLIVRAATRLLVGLLLMFSIWMLLRGHNEPGGGFIGGLIGATGFILYAVAHGSKAARVALRIDPQTIAMAGLGLALLAGLAGFIPGDGLFAGQWLFIGATETDKGTPLSTILVFDIGVYLVVLGAVLTMVFALEEEV